MVTDYRSSESVLEKQLPGTTNRYEDLARCQQEGYHLTFLSMLAKKALPLETNSSGTWRRCLLCQPMAASSARSPWGCTTTTPRGERRCIVFHHDAVSAFEINGVWQSVEVFNGRKHAERAQGLQPLTPCFMIWHFGEWSPMTLAYDSEMR